MNIFGEILVKGLSTRPVFDRWSSRCVRTLTLLTAGTTLLYPCFAEAKTLEFQISEAGFPRILSDALAKYQQGDAIGCATETTRVTNLVAAHQDKRDDYGALNRVGLEKVVLLAALCEATSGNASTANDEAALQKALEASKLRPGYGDARLVAAVMLGRLSRHAEAQAAFEEVLWFNKFTLLTGAQVRLESARSLRALGRNAEALVLLSEAGAGSTDPTVLGELIEGLIGAANKPEAVRVARLALAANPANEYLETCLAEALLLSVDRSFGIRDVTEAKTLVTPRAERAQVFNRDVGIYVRAAAALNEFEQARKLLSKISRSSRALPEFQAAEAQLAIEEKAAALSNTEGLAE